MTTHTVEPSLDGEGLRIGIVQSRFNEDASHGILSACLSELKHHGVEGDDVVHITVPGALEIPIALQKMAEVGQFDALIAVGAVIRGQTYHFELVANESARGISQVALEYDIPVINAVLTTQTEEQAEARMEDKGAHAARAAVELANLLSVLEGMADFMNDTDLDDPFGPMEEEEEGTSSSTVYRPNIR